MKKHRLVAMVRPDIKNRLKKYCSFNGITQARVIELALAQFMVFQEAVPQGFPKAISVTPKFGGRGTVDG